MDDLMDELMDDLMDDLLDDLMDDLMVDQMDDLFMITCSGIHHLHSKKMHSYITEHVIFIKRKRNNRLLKVNIMFEPKAHSHID